LIKIDIKDIYDVIKDLLKAFWNFLFIKEF